MYVSNRKHPLLPSQPAQVTAINIMGPPCDLDGKAVSQTFMQNVKALKGTMTASLVDAPADAQPAAPSVSRPNCGPGKGRARGQRVEQGQGRGQRSAASPSVQGVEAAAMAVAVTGAKRSIRCAAALQPRPDDASSEDDSDPEKSDMKVSVLHCIRSCGESFTKAGNTDL